MLKKKMYVLFYLKSNSISPVCITHIGKHGFRWRKDQRKLVRSMKFRIFSGTKCSLFQVPRMSLRGGGSQQLAEFSALVVISHLLKLPRGPVSPSSFSDGGLSGLCWNMIK